MDAVLGGLFQIVGGLGCGMGFSVGGGDEVGVDSKLKRTS